MSAAPAFWGLVSLLAKELSQVGAKIREIIKFVSPFKASTSDRLDEAKECSNTTVRVLSSMVVMKTTKKLVAHNKV